VRQFLVLLVAGCQLQVAIAAGIKNVAHLNGYLVSASVVCLFIGLFACSSAFYSCRFFL